MDRCEECDRPLRPNEYGLCAECEEEAIEALISRRPQAVTCD